MLSLLLALTFTQTETPAVGLRALASQSHYDEGTHRFVYLDGDADDGAPAVPLTWDPELQRPLQRLLDSYQAPLAQLVALDPQTGRVLAAIESTHGGPGSPDASAAFAEGVFPAASVFKLVTASALLARGIDPDEAVCFHGGKHRIHTKELDDDGARDHRCATLSEAVARSANVAIAKLAERNLDPVWLRDFATRFLFGQVLPSDFPTPPSLAAIPDEPFAFAQTAAGFGDVRLSAFHGAALAAAIANGGTLVPLRTLDAVHDVQDGDAQSAGPVRILAPNLAQALGDMMRRTVSEGTARKAFHFKGAKALEACGKTGSLSDQHPFRDYSWFVGFAPQNDPKIAVAALVVNGTKWRVHASALAAAAIRTYLKEVSTTGRQLTADR